MKYTLHVDKDGTQSAILPVAIDTPVFIIKWEQHDGYWVELKEYSINMIDTDVFLTRADAVQHIRELTNGSK